MNMGWRWCLRGFGISNIRLGARTSCPIASVPPALAGGSITYSDRTRRFDPPAKAGGTDIPGGTPDSEPVGARACRPLKRAHKFFLAGNPGLRSLRSLTLG